MRHRSRAEGLQKTVLRLKRENNALILAHNYQPIEIQQVADFVGDSLELARQSASVNSYDVVVFAGVRFMAEVAAILSEKTPVYLPRPDTLCPLASWLTPEKVRAKRTEYPDVPVVVYVNTTAEVKAEADAICTSGNAIQVIESLDADTVLFGPDASLAEYVRRRSHVRVIDLEPLGHCYVHRRFKSEDILALKRSFPDARVIAHPECDVDVQDIADYVCSTGSMARVISESRFGRFIVATEIGMVEQLRSMFPEREIMAAMPDAVCLQMKKNTLDGIVHVLRHRPPENLVTVPHEVAQRVRVLIDKMTQTVASAPAMRS